MRCNLLGTKDWAKDDENIHRVGAPNTINKQAYHKLQSNVAIVRHRCLGEMDVPDRGINMKVPLQRKLQDKIKDLPVYKLKNDLIKTSRRGVPGVDHRQIDRLWQGHTIVPTGTSKYPIVIDGN